MHKECFLCDLKQMKKVSQFLSLCQDKEDELIKQTKAYLTCCDMTKTNPEIMADIWNIVKDVTHDDDPYQDIKSFYNHYMMSLLPEIEDYIDGDIHVALKVTIAANLIDFSSKDQVTKEEIEQLLFQAKKMNLAIDDSQQFFHKLNESQILLYIGDNCGEIVLDKLLIKMLIKKYPQIQVFYGVRGKAIVNDVTLDDAREIDMEEVATVVNNGDESLGTVLSRTSLQFQNLFQQADIVICKGQGNYEGLIGTYKKELYLLFMSKCQIVSNMAGVSLFDIVCLKNNMQ
ncbi:MAG: damage-control phosphatase ARMT1 family protein [Faecalibacillus sp.]